MRRIRDEKSLKKYLNSLSLDKVIPEDLYEFIDIHSFDIHEALFSEDDRIEYLYVLLEGQIGVTPYSEMGKFSILDIVIPGDIIGDIEYFNGDNYYYQVVALTPSKVLAIPVQKIEKYLSQNVEFYQYTSENLAKKMKRTSHKYSRTMLYPLKNRLAKYLYDLYEIQGKEISGIQSSQTADYFGISPRHLRRVLSEIESEGIIIRRNKIIEVVDESKLSILASYK